MWFGIFCTFLVIAFFAWAFWDLLIVKFIVTIAIVELIYPVICDICTFIVRTIQEHNEINNQKSSKPNTIVQKDFVMESSTPEQHNPEYLDEVYFDELNAFDDMDEYEMCDYGFDIDEINLDHMELDEFDVYDLLDFTDFSDYI